jgi:hypothetical protein
MRPLLAGIITAAVVLIGYFHAPVVPVAIGAILGGAWCLWRARANGGSS